MEVEESGQVLFTVILGIISHYILVYVKPYVINEDKRGITMVIV